MIRLSRNSLTKWVQPFTGLQDCLSVLLHLKLSAHLFNDPRHFSGLSRFSNNFNYIPNINFLPYKIFLQITEMQITEWLSNHKQTASILCNISVIINFGFQLSCQSRQQILLLFVIFFRFFLNLKGFFYWASRSRPVEMEWSSSRSELLTLSTSNCSYNTFAEYLLTY